MIYSIIETREYLSFRAFNDPEEIRLRFIRNFQEVTNPAAVFRIRDPVMFYPPGSVSGKNFFPDPGSRIPDLFDLD
jgi:hypothetical protein